MVAGDVTPSSRGSNFGSKHFPQLDGLRIQTRLQKAGLMNRSLGMKLTCDHISAHEDAGCADRLATPGREFAC
jgi:hypothetical protein